MRNLIAVSVTAAALLGTLVGGPSETFAQTEIVEPEPTPWYENEPQYVDNTGPLGTGDNSAEIINTGDESATGAKKGEITIHKSDVGVDVYSGFNKVETIPKESDGWVGTVETDAGDILFTPSGRPTLLCPRQSMANWYGPCKLRDAEE